MAEITNEVLAERILNLHEMLERGFNENKMGHEALKKAIEILGIDHGSRLRVLEDWKIAFVAKLGVYAAAAIFLGTIAGSLLVRLLSNYI